MKRAKAENEYASKLVDAVDAKELAGLAQTWGPIARTNHQLEVDHPFLSGQHQMLVSDGRRAEICYVMYQGEPQTTNASEQALIKDNASEQALIKEVLLHIKTIYPSGAFRLPTGGIHQGESVADTLVREIWEETGLIVGSGPDQVQVERLLGLTEYALEHQGLGNTYAFATYYFLVRMPTGAELQPQDDSEMIGGWQWCPVAKLGEVAERLERVGATTPQWADWGRYRAVSHRFVMEQLQSRTK